MIIFPAQAFWKKFYGQVLQLCAPFEHFWTDSTSAALTLISSSADCKIKRLLLVSLSCDKSYNRGSMFCKYTIKYEGFFIAMTRMGPTMSEWMKQKYIWCMGRQVSLWQIWRKLITMA